MSQIGCYGFQELSLSLLARPLSFAPFMISWANSLNSKIRKVIYSTSGCCSESPRMQSSGHLGCHPHRVAAPYKLKYFHFHSKRDWKRQIKGKEKQNRPYLGLWVIAELCRNWRSFHITLLDDSMTPWSKDNKPYFSGWVLIFCQAFCLHSHSHGRMYRKFGLSYFLFPQLMVLFMEVFNLQGTLCLKEGEKYKSYNTRLITSKTFSHDISYSDTLEASGPCANWLLSVSIDISGVTHLPGTFMLRLTKWWLSFNDWLLPQSFPDWFRYSLGAFWECQGHWRGRLGTVWEWIRWTQALSLSQSPHSGSTSDNYALTWPSHPESSQCIMVAKEGSWTPLLGSMNAAVAPLCPGAHPRQWTTAPLGIEEMSRPRWSEEIYQTLPASLVL